MKHKCTGEEDILLEAWCVCASVAKIMTKLSLISRLEKKMTSKDPEKRPVQRRARVLQKRHDLKYTEALRIANKEKDLNGDVVIHGDTPEWFFLPDDPSRE